jgi:hypothetical protein
MYFSAGTGTPHPLDAHGPGLVVAVFAVVASLAWVVMMIRSGGNDPVTGLPERLVRGRRP